MALRPSKLQRATSTEPEPSSRAGVGPAVAAIMAKEYELEQISYCCRLFAGSAGAADAKIRLRPFVFFTVPLHRSPAVHVAHEAQYVAPAAERSTASSGDFDIGSGQHHVDIHAGALPIEHDENAACSRGHTPDFIPTCELYENKAKRNAERLWPSVSEDRRKECLGSLDDEIDDSFWVDFYLCLNK
jgi:hypothetical protein